MSHYHGDAEIVASFDPEDFSDVARDVDPTQLAVALDNLLADLGYAVMQGYNEAYGYYIIKLPDGR